MVPRISLRTLLLLTAGAALASFGISRLYVWPKEHAEKLIRSNPVQTHMEVREAGTLISSWRITYSVGDYGVAEFGNIRLAVRGCTFNGESFGSLDLANDSNSSGGGGATGVGNRRFTSHRIPGGNRCTFAGLTFDIKDGMLHLLDQQFRVDGKDRLILVDQSGKIESTPTIGQ